MELNRNKVDHWKADSAASVDFYNNWFLDFAPRAFREARRKSERIVESAFSELEAADMLSGNLLAARPRLMTVLRMMTCPPIARDRLAGLASVAPSAVKNAEETGKWKRAMPNECVSRIFHVLWKLLDKELFSWLLSRNSHGDSISRDRAVLIVADRLCGAMSDPYIRNAQEKRQLTAIEKFLVRKGYSKAAPSSHEDLLPGQFAFHLNIRVHIGDDGSRSVNIPVDVAIQPRSAQKGRLPLIIEAKSAGDFANVNKRRKEEAQKVAQLRQAYGDVRFYLFLCGYFDSGYLGYEAAEGIDWIWEHRMSDMEKLGL